jgi:hypothetical protein
VQRALLVEGRGRTSIIVQCHHNNDNAVINKAAVMMTMTQLSLAMALSATQNNNQQMKGANKRGDSVGNGNSNGDVRQR